MRRPRQVHGRSRRSNDALPTRRRPPWRISPPSRAAPTRPAADTSARAAPRPPGAPHSRGIPAADPRAGRKSGCARAGTAAAPPPPRPGAGSIRHFSRHRSASGRSRRNGRAPLRPARATDRPASARPPAHRAADRSQPVRPPAPSRREIPPGPSRVYRWEMDTGHRRAHRRRYDRGSRPALPASRLRCLTTDRTGAASRPHRRSREWCRTQVAPPTRRSPSAPRPRGQHVIVPAAPFPARGAADRDPPVRAAHRQGSPYAAWPDRVASGRPTHGQLQASPDNA